MNKFIVSIIASLAFANLAVAGDYAGISYQDKQKVGVDEQHDVLGAYLGHNFSNTGFSVEGLLEEEIVHDPSEHEGLVQVKGSYTVPAAVLDLYPYVSAAVGYKSLSNDNFNFYVLETGLKYNGLPNVELRYGLRLRTPFNESSVGEGYHYRTVENSINAVYKLDGHNSVSLKYAREHGDSDYHTYGIGLAHSF
jgi:hypothetical protein